MIQLPNNLVNTAINLPNSVTPISYKSSTVDERKIHELTVTVFYADPLSKKPNCIFAKASNGKTEEVSLPQPII
jgi:hypothetical protein